MDLKIQSGTVLMLKRLLDRMSPVKTYVGYSPGKPPLDEDETKFFDRITPEEAGISSGSIDGLISELFADNATDLHTLLILRGGKVVYEGEYGAYRLRYPCSVHSMSKSVAAMGVRACDLGGAVCPRQSRGRLFPRAAESAVIYDS